MFRESVLNTIKKYNLIEEGDRIVLGVSGGPDSISMIDVLNDLSKDMNFEIFCAHINHGLRENAKLDEEFVKNYCDERNIECYILHEDVAKVAKESKRGIEETGRTVRYDFFEKIAEETNSNKICIAHNKNDKVETILMNIMRGSGMTGLIGIEPKNGKYIRPLIETERSEIEEYCKEKNLNPRHDESNDDNNYTRNKIRNVVIPYVITNFNPNFIETISRLSDIAKDDIDYMEIVTANAYNDLLITEIKDKNEKIIKLDLRKFNKLEKNIQKKVILYTIKQIFGSTQGIEKIHVEDMIKLCNNNIGNKYLTPNKKTKIVIKNKQIILSGQI